MVPVNFTTALYPNDAIGPPNGQALSPGTVSYQNSWNLTAKACPQSTSGPAQPLAAQNQWSTTLAIPAQLFMGTPTGRYITQTYVVSQNGTFAVTDGSGNSLSISPLGGLPPGVVVFSLKANSTEAVQNLVIGNGKSIIANVTVVYSVKHQFCQPSGIKLTIEGIVNWPGKTGTLSLSFKSSPLKAEATRAWFGNRSGVWLGFDWADSLAFSPAYGASSNKLSWSVGTTFTIDPVTIASIQGEGLGYGYQGRICYAAGLYWVFGFDGFNGVWGYSTSSDGGNTWSSKSSFSDTSNGYSYGTSFYCSGSTLYYVSGESGSNNRFLYRYGTLQAGGTISWTIPETAVATTYTNDRVPSVAVDSSGNIFAAVTETQSLDGPPFPKYLEVWRGTSCTPTCTWTLSLQVGGIFNGALVPLTSNKMGLVYNLYSGGSLYAVFYSGSAWGSASATSGSYTLPSSGLTSIGDTVEVAAVASTTQNYLSVAYSTTPSWSSPTQLEASSGYCYMGIASDGASNLIAYVGHSNVVDYYKSSDSGSTWSASTTLSTSEASLNYLSVMPFFSGLSAAAWQSGSTSPINIRFSAVPVVIPTAATSASSWSRPGVSPYESYFTHFSEYVSPGNGLLALEQGTLDLPGRGLSLDPALVFSTPYAFSSSAPYLYDSYPLANLGNGWSFNFPWVGTNYLHLTDGQAYPYAWSGSVFEYHGATDFKLVNNGASGYTLWMRGGTQYQFNSAKQLTSITDRTGYNAISFSYGTNGYISQITDTIGRIVTLSYNANNLLTSIVSGSRSWSLGYSGTSLVSVTDPLSRITTYQYNTGINSWLISAVLYPTGGKTTYAYGSAPVGTEVTTYYVTSRNTYYSSTQLSQSDSISYTVVNGAVTWSDMTISDGVNVQGYVNNNFQAQNNLMLVYSEDKTGTLIRTTESDFDASGRIIETKAVSPSGTLLAYSLSSYDSWGNVKYARDRVGHETWLSYANTDSQSSFGTSGCSSSFYTQTIASNVHDALVGQCAYQNGAGSPQMQTYYKYDSNTNLLEAKVLHNGAWLYTDRTYDSYGNVLTITDALGRVTYFRYSSTYSSAYMTKQSILVGTQNVTTNYTYDSAKGFMLSVTDPNGQTTSYQYDNLGRLTLVTYPGGATKQYAYDDTNNVLTSTDEDGHVTKQYFDGLARMTKAERWNGSSVYSTTSYTYNWLDAIATMTVPSGSVYSYSYDWAGRQTKVTNPDSTSRTVAYDDVSNLQTATDENGHQTVYSYDWANRLVSVKQYNASSSYYLTTYACDLTGNLLTTTDAKAQVTTYSYDDLNRPVTTTFPDTKAETRTYDSVGNMLTRTTANGSQISYAYDALNRLTGVAYPGSGGTVTLTYDAGSNRLSIANPSATVYDRYDARGRISNETSSISGSKYQTLYAYDAAGNIVTLTYPDSYSLSMTYDVANRMKTLGSFATIGYNVDDKIAKTTYGNGEVTTYSYDARDRPTRILDKVGSTKYLDLNFTYGATGNVLTENTETYSYDWLDRVTQTTGPWSTTTYTYDQVGNRVKMVAGSTTTLYTYGSYNRLSSAGSTAYAYDANGNMITKTGGWAYSYDYENRLTKVAKSGTTVQQNFYDGASNRVKQTAGDTTVYTYQGVNIVYEKDLTTSTVTKHFWANGVQIAKIAGSTTYYLNQDQVHSTRLVLTSALTSSFSSNYLPFGPPSGKTGSEVFAYAGKANDSATGLAYFGARFYDSTMGRFITQDSSMGALLDPLSLNRYVYARENPLKTTDPTGHDWWSSFTGAISNTITAVTNAWNSLPAPVQTGIVIAGLVGIGLATGGLGDVAALAASGDYFGATAVALTGGGIVAGAAIDAAPGEGATAIDATAGGLTEATLTNDEFTWTSLEPATRQDQAALDNYLSMMSNQIVNDIQGGVTEYRMTLPDQSTIEADNYVDASGHVSENKIGAVYGGQPVHQLNSYLDILDQNEGGSLDYNFFLSPSTGKIGPSSGFASTFVPAASAYDLGINIFNYDWWGAFQ